MVAKKIVDEVVGKETFTARHARGIFLPLAWRTSTSRPKRYDRDPTERPRGMYRQADFLSCVAY